MSIDEKEPFGILEDATELVCVAPDCGQRAEVLLVAIRPDGTLAWEGDAACVAHLGQDNVVELIQQTVDGR